jgi:hypothetical protein
MLRCCKMLTGKIINMKSINLYMNLNTVVNYQFVKYSKNIPNDK